MGYVVNDLYSSHREFVSSNNETIKAFYEARIRCSEYVADCLKGFLPFKRTDKLVDVTKKVSDFLLSPVDGIAAGAYQSVATPIQGIFGKHSSKLFNKALGAKKT